MIDTGSTIPFINEALFSKYSQYQIQKLQTSRQFNEILNDTKTAFLFLFLQNKTQRSIL